MPLSEPPSTALQPPVEQPAVTHMKLPPQLTHCPFAFGQTPPLQHWAPIPPHMSIVDASDVPQLKSC